MDDRIISRPSRCRASRARARRGDVDVGRRRVATRQSHKHPTSTPSSRLGTTRRRATRDATPHGRSRVRRPGASLARAVHVMAFDARALRTHSTRTRDAYCGRSSAIRATPLDDDASRLSTVIKQAPNRRRRRCRNEAPRRRHSARASLARVASIARVARDRARRDVSRRKRHSHASARNFARARRFSQWSLGGRARARCDARARATRPRAMSSTPKR